MIETLFAAAVLSMGIVALTATVLRSGRTQGDDVARARAAEIVEERAAALLGGGDAAEDLADPVLGDARLVTRAAPPDPRMADGAERDMGWREIVLTWRRRGRAESLSVVVARPS